MDLLLANLKLLYYMARGVQLSACPCPTYIQYRKIDILMKHCTNCQYTLPDNFIACPNCGTQLSEQPDPGSAPMQMFMYDEQMGQKIGTDNSMNHVLKMLLISIFLFIIIIPVVVVVSNANMIAMAITLFIWFAVIVATVVCAFVISYKKSVARTSYIYYNGILYREILWAGQNLWIYVNGVKTGNEMGIS